MANPSLLLRSTRRRRCPVHHRSNFSPSKMMSPTKVMSRCRIQMITGWIVVGFGVREHQSTSHFRNSRNVDRVDHFFVSRGLNGEYRTSRTGLKAGMLLSKVPASGAEQRTQAANIANLLQLPHSVAELAGARPADHRSHQIVALFVHLGSRHWVLGGAAHGLGVMPELAPVAQADLDDSLAARHGGGQCIVGAKFDTTAQRQYSTVAHAPYVVRGCEGDVAVDQHDSAHMLYADVGHI